MKRFAKSMIGVTLLEIMLVLAIASMIIVMSVRYYQSASQSNQINAFLQQVQGITASVENLAQGSSYSAVTSDQLLTILPGGKNGLVPPWGGTMTFAPAASGFVLTPSVAPSGAMCTMITTKLQLNNHFTVAASCASITYNAAS